MTSPNGSIFRVTGPLCGDFTGHRLIPRTKASDAELWCFLWSALWRNGCENNREAGNLRGHRSHYDVIVILGAHDCNECPSILVSTFSMMHYGDVLMGAIASQITGISIVYSIVFPCADQRKHKNSASLAFVRRIHQWPVNSHHKGPMPRKMFPFDGVIMTCCYRYFTSLVVMSCDSVHWLKYLFGHRWSIN